MSEDKIRIATSIPGLKDKIKTNIVSNSDTIFWNIKFNIPLDPDSVSYKTMHVTDTEGYIMRTEISYSIDKNLILIAPLDSYEQNRYYLLSISKKVKSAGGQKLRSEIHILFKLVGGQISEYKVLKSNVTIPKPTQRPRNYDKLQNSGMETSSRVYTFNENLVKNLPQDKLPYGPINVNILIGIIGVFLTVASVALKNPVYGIWSLVVCVIGLLHILLQFRKNDKRSVLMYNLGVGSFNKGDFKKSQKYFKIASEQDPNNELAEYGLTKVKFYI